MQTAVPIVLALALAIQLPLGEPFLINGLSFTARWGRIQYQEIPGFATGPPWRSQCRAMASTKKTLSAAQRTADTGAKEKTPGDENIEDVLTQARVIAAAAAKRATTEDRDAEAAAERLHREVFANEKGFLESQEFNPRRAREKEEEEEVKNMAAHWGSTPEKAREVLEKTKENKELSFQELDAIARDLKLTDDQQRSFMMKASIKKLADATALPKRTWNDPVREALRERVFEEETGFLQNSEEFKDKLKEGSGVRFDNDGFPVLNEGDPALQAVNRSKRSSEQNATFGLEGVVFPSLPDCPRCSAPTTEDELSQFGMCSQCKALEVSTTTYTGPSAPSKYTYDNGEAPFSDSWRPRRGKDGRRPDRSTVEPGDPPPPSSRRTVDASSPRAASLDHEMMDRRDPKHGPDKASPQPTSQAPKRAVIPQRRRTPVASAVTPTSQGRTPHSPGLGSASAADERAFARSHIDSRGISSTQPRDDAGILKEVAELQSKLAEVSAAVKMERGVNARQGSGDAAVRTLRREVAELRTMLEAKVVPNSSNGSDAAMRKLLREVTELRADLAQARKEQSLTQLALRSVREQVESLLASRDSSQ